MNLMTKKWTVYLANIIMLLNVVWGGLFFFTKSAYSASKEEIFLGHLKTEYREDTQVYSAFKSVLDKRSKMELPNLEVVILSLPGEKSKEANKIVKGFGYATGKKIYSYESMKLKDEEAVINDLMNLITSSPSLILEINRAEALPERAQKFINLLGKKEKEINISFVSYSKTYKIPENSDISIIMVTDAGQTLLQLTDNKINSDHFKKSLRLEGFEDYMLESSIVTLMKPKTRRNIESLVKTWINETISHIESKRKNLDIVLRDEQKLVDVILYHHADNKTGIDYDNAKENIEHLITKAYTKSLSKLKKGKKTLEIYALNN